MPKPKVAISDSTGNEVGVTGNALDVHLKTGTSSIDIGDVSLLLGGTAASVNNGTADATTLRVTIASNTTGVLSVDDNGSTLSIDDGGGAITVDGTVTAGHDITGMVHGINDDVDTSAEQLDGSTSGLDQACKRVDLMGHPDNTGDIYVGSTDAIVGDGSVGGIRLQAGDFYSIDIDNLNDIWIEASVNNQKLNYIYYT